MVFKEVDGIYFFLIAWKDGRKMAERWQSFESLYDLRTER